MRFIYSEEFLEISPFFFIFFIFTLKALDERQFIHIYNEAKN